MVNELEIKKLRELKGAFYTPQIWVELSQKYLADTLGEDWQDEYYIWDCAAGTGNLLAGLTNKYHIFASTLDRQDVDVMKDRIANGANLLEKHVFQFDFLNDDFKKLPQALQDIINDPEKRKKLVIYINPPYAEAGDTKQRMSSGKNKDNVSNQTLIRKKYASIMNNYAQRELFIQFFIRVYAEIQGAVLAEFSTLKILQAPYFSEFRNYFLAELQSMFVVPSHSFDNVKGRFPIGFMIWNTHKQQKFHKIESKIYNINGTYKGKKIFYNYDNDKNLNDWLRPTWDNIKADLGYLTCNSNDFQNSVSVFIQSNKNNETSTYYKPIAKKNLIMSCIYFTTRKCIDANWLNDRDQFLYPNENRKTDTEFQNNCFAYTLFHGQNRISSKDGVNHWIPFTEYEVNAQEKFASSFMTDFIMGKLKPAKVEEALFKPTVSEEERTTPLEFSTEAKVVFEAGKALWQYYHAQKDANVNASLYDIREYFQGRNDKDRMNSKSEDETYTKLIADLREKLQLLAAKIEPKVYEYGFLKS